MWEILGLTQEDFESVQAVHLRRQCDFASVRADNLRTHLKIHSGEKSIKCDQCDFASIPASILPKREEQGADLAHYRGLIVTNTEKRVEF